MASQVHAPPEASLLMPRPPHCLLSVARKMRKGVRNLLKRQQGGPPRHPTLLPCVVQKWALLVEKPGIVGSVLKALYLLSPSYMFPLAVRQQAPKSSLYLWVPCILLPRNSRPPKATEGGIK